MSRRRGGFTLVEILLVVSILGIVARVAMPRVQHVLTRARAAEILGEVAVVRTAAAQHLAEHHVWPEDVEGGRVPEGLLRFLPEGYSFEGEGYTLDWDRWPLPDGLPGDPSLRSIAGVTVVPGSDELGDALRGLAGGRGWFRLGADYTWVLVRE